MKQLLSADETAARLPYENLVAQLRELLTDASVQVPERLIQALPGGGSLFVMPAHDSRIAITKLITFTPANAGTDRPAIQGDVVVFDVATGERKLILDGPTVTARRTAAVSLLAAQTLAAGKDGPNEALADCPLVVTCTPATQVVLQGLPRSDAFIAAVGAFTPRMMELGPELCRHFAAQGRIVVDTPDAVHEAGDLLQAGLDVRAFATLRDVLGNGKAAGGAGPVLFKSCGWAGWDLAAARTALLP